MKALVKARCEEGLELQEVPEPKIGPHDALIEVRAAGICGTDVHIYEWDKWSRQRVRPPLVAGHEFVGTVAAVGRDVGHIKPGVRVSAEGHIVCGRCQFCRTGQGHICQNVHIIGIDRDGCFAEFLAMPADNLWPIPDDIPDRHAAVLDPLGNAMHTVMTAPVSAKSVLIIGAGAIGLFAVTIAKAAGASTVFVSEPNEMKRAIASRIGADTVVNPFEDDVQALVLEATEGLGAEVVLEMSGAEEGLKSAFRLVRNGGDVVLLGIPSAEVAVDWAKDIIFKGITIHAVNGRRMYDTWYQCQRFLLAGRMDIDPVITHTMPMEEFESAFAALLTGQAAKIVLTLQA